MVIACKPCRRRKIKCDGIRPSCLQCNLRIQPCSYSKVADKRRLSYNDYEEASNKLDTCMKMLDAIAKGGSMGDKMIEKLRKDQNVMKKLTDESISSTPLDNAETERKLWRRENEGEIYLYGETSNFPMIMSNEIIHKEKPNPKIVADNDNLSTRLNVSEERILELLSLYFCWQHTYYSVLDRDLFLRDMNCKGPFYSDFLLCCMLTHSLHFSSKIDYLSQKDKTSLLSDVFQEAALEMLQEELENPSVTTVQGLLLLASKESGIGKSSLGWIHSGIAFRIAIALGLHLDTVDIKDNKGLSEDEIRVKRATFWGCYIFDQGWGLYLGRPYAINDDEISLPFPSYIDESPISWSPFYELSDSVAVNDSIEFQPRNTSTAIIKLYRILKDITRALYSSKRARKKNYKELLTDCYNKLLDWKSELPSTFQMNNKVLHPATIMLHTMYYSAIIFLFRPFFKLGGSNWNYQNLPDPLQIGSESARCIVSLLSKYKSQFNLRNIVNLATYVISTAITVFIALNSFSEWSDLEDLTICQDLLHEIASSWPDSETIYQRVKQSIKNYSLNTKNLQMILANSDWDISSMPEWETILFGSDIYLDWDYSN